MKVPIFGMLCACMILISCNDLEPLPESLAPTPLMDATPSLLSPEAVRRLPRFRSSHWRIKDHTKVLRDGRPPFDELVVSLTDFDSHSTTGELLLDFYNGKLMSMTYYPTDQGVYEKLVNNAAFQKDVGGRWVHRVPGTPATLVVKGQDHRGRRFVSWEDERLARHLLAWIERYS